MPEYIFIKDTVTGVTLQIIKQFPYHYLVIRNCSEAEEVKKASVRKIIRTWMEGVKSGNC